MQHFMLDIETLGTRPGAVVLSAAFIRFSDYQATSLVLNRDEQQALALETDSGTWNWWLQQSQAARDAAFLNPVPLVPALEHFARWLQWAAPDGQFNLWCHGASFDAPLLGEVYRRANVPCPWTFRQVRCTRTLYDLAGINPADFSHGTAHNALDDAIGQTKAAVAAFAKLAGRYDSAGGNVSAVVPT